MYVCIYVRMYVYYIYKTMQVMYSSHFHIKCLCCLKYLSLFCAITIIKRIKKGPFKIFQIVLKGV